jgi:serine/threonine protein kinase
VWAIGIIAYELSTFTLPFTRASEEASKSAILNDPHDSLKLNHYSDELKDLIASLLMKDPEFRPSL